jgi:hypothetical protein
MSSVGYEDVIGRMFVRMRAYDFLNMDDESITEKLTQWMHSAVFKPYVRRLFDSIVLDDDFEDISYTMHYTIDADADREFVIEVLSIGVCRAWLEEKILDITNIKQLFSDKNSKWYSQAAHLNELQALYSSLDAEQKRLISDRNSMSNRYIEEYRL